MRQEEVYMEIETDAHRTSLASPITASRSCTTKRRLGWRLASVNDCEPTPPPTSITSESGGSFSHPYPVGMMHQVRRWQTVESDKPSRSTSPDDMFVVPVIAAPNLARRNLFSGSSNQLHISPSKPSALFRAVLFGSVACPNSGSRSVSVR